MNKRVREKNGLNFKQDSVKCRLWTIVLRVKKQWDYRIYPCIMRARTLIFDHVILKKKISR